MSAPLIEPLLGKAEHPTGHCHRHPGGSKVTVPAGTSIWGMATEPQGPVPEVSRGLAVEAFLTVELAEAVQRRRLRARPLDIPGARETTRAESRVTHPRP